MSTNSTLAGIEELKNIGVEVGEASKWTRNSYLPKNIQNLAIAIKCFSV